MRKPNGFSTGRVSLPPWPTESRFSAARTVAARLIPGGDVLPYTRRLGTAGYPVVAWDAEALGRRRRSAYAAPVLRLADAARLAHRTHGVQIVPPALRILGFIGASPVDRAARDLAGMRTLTRTILMLSPGVTCSEPTLSEFDAMGITVMSTSSAGSVEVVVVAGDPGRRPGTDLHPGWLRLREEQLYDLVLRSGHRRSDLAHECC